jgi:RNA polymerase sigma-70 factor (ECF subfamily)
MLSVLTEITVSEREAKQKWDGNQVCRVLKGDVKAFWELVESYYPVFYHISIGYLKQVETVEDVLQEGIMAIYQGLPGLKDPEHFGSWAYTVIKRKAVDAGMRAKKEKGLREAGDPTVARTLRAFSGGNSVQSDPVKQAQYEKLWEAVNELEERYRDPVILHYFHGYTFEEVGVTLGISANAVGMRLRRAKDILRQGMEENKR